MRGEREKDEEALVAAYGIGRRLATRVAALRSQYLDVTGTVLAEAADAEPLQRLLLLPQLLSAPESITEQRLQQEAAELGYGEAELLRLVGEQGGEWRTIALQDDVLAEQARGPEEEVALEPAGEGEITSEETAELFSPEQVAELKLTVLTSQNPEERVEALRKMVFAPMEGAQKASIFLNVLIDREAEPRVRREAVRSLEQIGFRSDMAEAVRGLFQEDPEETVYAIQRLGVLLREAEPDEAALVLAVVLEVFDQSKTPEILRELLELIRGSAAILVTNYQKTERFIESALRHLDRSFDELRPSVEDAVAACAEHARELTADLLWRELQRKEGPRTRSLLLNMVESLVQQEERTRELAELAVAELVNPRLPESEKARLRYGLVRIGEPAVLVALSRLGSAAPAEHSELIRLVDTLCTEGEVSEQTLKRAVGSLVDLLKVGDVMTRRGVLEATLVADPRVEDPLQQELAGELLTLMTELNMPGTLDTIGNTLERIGAPSLRPAYHFMQRAYPSEAAQRAALALGQIIQAEPERVEQDLAARVLELCMGLLEDETVEEGAFTVTLAAVCGYTEPGGEKFREALERLKDDLWTLPYTMDALDALGIMGGSRNAGPRSQQELFELFDAIVRYQAGTALGTRKETEEGVVYEFGREIEFDVRAVPAAVRGLERIGVSEQASPQMRAEIVKRLLVLWEGVSKVRIIWGPAAVEALIHAMRVAACSPTATARMKERLGLSLLRFLNKIGVIRSIGEICSQPDESPEVRKLALEATSRMLDEWEAADVQDEERKLALLRSAGKTAANEALDAEAREVREMRERTLSALFSGLREGMTELREELLGLRECSGLSSDQKREIDERLSKAFGLVPIGSVR